MAGESVDNFFKQPSVGDPLKTRDNALVVGGSMETATEQNLKTRFFTISIGDISAPGNFIIAPGVAGSIVNISGVVEATITGTSTLTFEISGVTMTGTTIAFAVVAGGTVVQFAPTTLNVITALGSIKVINDGASANPSNSSVTFEILLS